MPKANLYKTLVMFNNGVRWNINTIAVDLSWLYTHEFKDKMISFHADLLVENYAEVEEGFGSSAWSVDLENDQSRWKTLPKFCQDCASVEGKRKPATHWYVSPKQDTPRFLCDKHTIHTSKCDPDIVMNQFISR